MATRSKEKKRIVWKSKNKNKPTKQTTTKNKNNKKQHTTKTTKNKLVTHSQTFYNNTGRSHIFNSQSTLTVISRRFSNKQAKRNTKIKI